MDIKLSSWKQTASDNFLPNLVFDPIFNFNPISELWECFPEEITKKNKELLEMIHENPSKYLWSEKDMDVAGFGKMQKREEKYKKEGDSLYARIETACLLGAAREEFERNFISYVETRITFEDKLDQVVNIMNMLTLMEYEPGDVKPQLKDKIKDLLESGLSYGLKVGKFFNKMTQYSLNMVPEIPGNYNWYSF